jgi:hypothetical protein
VEQNVVEAIRFLPSGGTKYYWKHTVVEQNVVGSHVFLRSSETKYYWSHTVAEQNFVGSHVLLPSCGTERWEPYLSTQWRNKMLLEPYVFYPVAE